MRLFVLFVSTLLLAACGGQEAPPAPPALPVAAAKPIVKSIQEWDEYSGRFEAVDYVEVRSRISGYLQSIHFRDGEIVRAGDLLFVIDPRPFEVALAEARAALKDAVAQRDFAQTEVERVEALAPKGFVPGRTVDQRRQQLASAAAAVERARAAIAEAELNLGYTRIRAPVTGRTSARTVSIGNLVTGGSEQGTLLTTVASIDPIRFIFDADEAAYLKYVRLNAEGSRPSSRDAANPVRLQLAGESGFPHVGRMDFVDNQIDPNTGTMRGRATFANPQAVFIPGMFGRMQLLGSGRYDAVLVPDEAIGSDQTQKIVYVVAPDKSIAPRPVVLGPLYEGLRIVRSGLKPDETIVINGLMRLRPGLKVEPQLTTIQQARSGATSGKQG